MRERMIQLLLAFHEGTSPSTLLQDVAAMVVEMKLREREWAGPEPFDPAAVDIFALLVDARTGISAGMINCWQYFAERQYPRVLLVQGTELAESDFDDIVLIANRTLEIFATPYLVLHDDLGQPTGLIELARNSVIDYSGSEVVEYPADADLQDLVTEFKEEQSEFEEELSEGAFLEGMRAIALPIGETKPIGVRELNKILKSLAKR